MEGWAVARAKWKSIVFTFRQTREESPLHCILPAHTIDPCRIRIYIKRLAQRSLAKGCWHWHQGLSRHPIGGSQSGLQLPSGLWKCEGGFFGCYQAWERRRKHSPVLDTILHINNWAAPNANCENLPLELSSTVTHCTQPHTCPPARNPLAAFQKLHRYFEISNHSGTEQLAPDVFGMSLEL